jgi:N-acyl homoserine lactone hydrolase
LAAIKIRVLECGRTSLDYELALTGHPDRLLTQDHQAGDRQWLHHPIYAYVIEHPDGPILVDTGVSPDFERNWRHPFYPGAMAYNPGEGGLFTQRLEQAGYFPEDFKYVVISHLHTDHAGNAPMFQNAGAKILVHEEELRGAVTLKGSLLRDDDVTLWGSTSVQGFTRKDFGFLVPDRATTVYADMEIARNVWTVSLPGHTWGTLGVAVRLEHSGWVLIASDAIYLADTYGHPFVGSILNQHQENWARSALKVRRMAEQYGMTILPGHDDTVITKPAGKTGIKAPLQSVYE